jgi:hypothetical protein
MEGRCGVRRLAVAFLAVPFSLLLAAGPVAADTSPFGTSFNSGTETCSTTGGKQVCTSTNLGVNSNEDGSLSGPCLEIYKYSISNNGRFSLISDENGCTSDASGVTIGADLSVTIAPTPITLDQCNKGPCNSPRTVTVSASDSPTDPITTTTSRSTTKSGGCTTRTTTTDTYADVAGTMTIDGTVLDETGFVDVFASTSTTHCK